MGDLHPHCQRLGLVSADRLWQQLYDAGMSIVLFTRGIYGLQTFRHPLAVDAGARHCAAGWAPQSFLGLSYRNLGNQRSMNLTALG